MLPLTHISLCTGIGGFDDAAEAAGFTNIANCEIDKKCRIYLKNRYPNATQYTNVISNYPTEKTTVLSFGFPCQDISVSGKGAGIFGEKSKIFFNCLQVARHTLPNYIIIENSPMLIKRGLGHVLLALSQQGYYTEWFCLSGSQFGFPIMRKRIFIIAKPLCKGLQHSILKPPGTFKLSKQWAPGKTFVHASASRANRFANITAICRGNVIPNNNFWLHAIGNAVMPVVAEHIFYCIKNDIENV